MNNLFNLKKNWISITSWVLLAGAALFFASCQNPFERPESGSGQGNARIVLSLKKESVRTLDGEIDYTAAKFHVQLRNSTGVLIREFDMDGGAGDSGEFPIGFGSYAVAVQGFNSRDELILEGTSSLEVSQGGANNCTVSLTYVGGKGSAAVSIQWPREYMALVCSLQLLNPPEGFSSVQTLTRTDSTSEASAQWDIADMPAGSYKVFISLSDSVNEVASRMEALTIAANQQTTGIISFLKEEMKYTSRPVLVAVEGGTFHNGTANVTVSSFKMSKYEITQLQYQAVMGTNPSGFQGEGSTLRPVEQVSWYDALVYCNMLSLQEGLTPVYSISGSTDSADWGEVPTSQNATWDAAVMNMAADGYRLPTEAEWMWATMGAPADGQGGGVNTTGYTKAFAGSTGSNSVGDYAWSYENAASITHIIGTKFPNELGLYDMSGNVKEWCWDWSGSYSTGAVINPAGRPNLDSYRVLLGGSWDNYANYNSVNNQWSNGPYAKSQAYGFRLVQRDPIYPTSITLNKSTQTLYLGETSQLTSTLTPVSTNLTTVTWQSNNTTVVTVDAQGKVLAVGLGTAVITSQSQADGVSATCVVTVNSWPMVSVPAGAYQRDDTTGNITRVSAFKIGKYEVTQILYQVVMGTNPSYFNTVENGPVERVSWYDALVFCNNLSMMEGLNPVYSIGGSTNPADWGAVPTSQNATWDATVMNMAADGYRLPTEGEWMWAAMGAPADGQGGGVNTTGYTKAFAGSTGTNNVEDYAWTSENSGSTTHTVGTKLPNELGLYDISGNVWEWNWDWYGSYSIGDVINPVGPSSGTYRVFRDSSWYSIAEYITVASRDYYNPPYDGSNHGVLGFRLVRP